MTRAEMLKVLDPSDIIEMMVPSNQLAAVESYVNEFTKYNHGFTNDVQNALIIFSLLKAEHYLNFIVYLRRVAETFKSAKIDTGAKALEFIKINRDIRKRNGTYTQSKHIGNEPDWLDKYLLEIEQMG